MRNKRRVIMVVVFVVLVMLLISGCVPGDGRANPDNEAGFFWGIWHGWVAPVSLIISIFDRTIRIYEVHNTGWWYDLGYYMAVISGFGGLALFRRKRHTRED